MPRPNSCMSLVGPEGVEDLLPLLVAQLVEDQLVVVADEVRVLAVLDALACRDRLGERFGSLACERQVHALHHREVEQQLHLVALVAEELAQSLGRQVHLAQQEGVALASRHELVEVLEEVVGVESASLAVAPSSSRNGTASTRKPSTPSSSQKPAIFAISSRTLGFAMFSSGWCE